MHTVSFVGLALCSWRRLSDSSVCHILGWRYLARLLRSVVKSETPDQITVDGVILSDEPAELAGTFSIVPLYAEVAERQTHQLEGL